MEDFKIKKYEWQKNMNNIMQNVNLDKIDIVDNTVTLEFLNSYDGKQYKKIVCKTIWKFVSDMCFSNGDGFPVFVCDITTKKLEGDDIILGFDYLNFGEEIPKSKEYNLLSLYSGDLTINLICKSIEIY